MVQAEMMCAQLQLFVEWIKGNYTYNIHIFNYTRVLRIRMKADTFDFPLSLAAIKDWASYHSLPLLRQR